MTSSIKTSWIGLLHLFNGDPYSNKIVNTVSKDYIFHVKLMEYINQFKTVGQTLLTISLWQMFNYQMNNTILSMT